MFSFNFKSNLKKATTGNRIKEDLSAVAVPLVYWTVPTLLGLQGWSGLAVGTLSTWFVGAALDLPGMTSGAIATASTHIFHSFFRDEFVNIVGKEPWNFEPTTPNGTGTTSGVYGLAEGQSMVPVPDGQGGYQYVNAYQATDMPGGSVSDYYLPQVAGMGDFYQPDSNPSFMSDDFDDELMDEMASEY